MPDKERFVYVSELLGEELAKLRLSVLCGESRLDNRILNPRVQKPGLAFAGYYDYIKPGRVQIVPHGTSAMSAWKARVKSVVAAKARST